METKAVAGDRNFIGRTSIYLRALCSVLIISSIAFYPWLASFADEQAEGKPKKPRFETTELTIKDNLSGLMWSLNGSLSDITYSWYDAVEFVGLMNQEHFAGHSDWRIPTREELLLLSSYARSTGYDGTTPDRSVAAGLQAIGIRNVRMKEYWSSTVNLYNASEAWFVSLLDGSPGTGGKSLYLSVWPVRSAD